MKAALQERLLDEIGERGLLENDGADVAAAVQDFAARAIASEDVALNDAERVRLAEELTDETIGMGPLAPLLADPAVSDILVNAPDQVYVERFGRLERTDVRFRDAEHIVRVIERIAARVGRRIDTASPMVDLRLPDGSRVNATLPPVDDRRSDDLHPPLRPPAAAARRSAQSRHASRRRSSSFSSSPSARARTS